MNNIHSVVETIRMVDGTQSDISWKSDDLNAIELFYESLSIGEITKIIIDGTEITLPEAEHRIFKWEQMLLLKYEMITEDTFKDHILEENKRFYIYKTFGV